MSQKAPSIAENRICFSGKLSHYRMGLVALDQHPALAAVLLDAPGNHLHRHADRDRIFAQISKA
jgi:hypothetical protein